MEIVRNENIIHVDFLFYEKEISIIIMEDIITENRYLKHFCGNKEERALRWV